MNIKWASATKCVLAACTVGVVALTSACTSNVSASVSSRPVASQSVSIDVASESGAASATSTAAPTSSAAPGVQTSGATTGSKPSGSSKAASTGKAPTSSHLTSGLTAPTAPLPPPAAGTSPAGSAGASAMSTGAGPAATSPSAKTTPATSSSKPAATKSAAPKVTAPVPPIGGGGNVNQTIASQSVRTATTVPLGKPASPAGGLQISLRKFNKIAAKPLGPGEMQGPAVEFTVSVTNNSKSTVDLSAVAITVVGPSNTPGVQMSGPPSKAFTGSVSVGKTAIATYVFRFPAFPKDVRVAVRLDPSVSVAEFTGAVS